MAEMLAWLVAGRSSADKCLRVRLPLGDVKKTLPHSHFARSKVFSYKEISIRLKNLRNSFRVEGYSVR
jgi:hypothetical protein